MSRTLDTAAIAQWLRPTRAAGLALLTTHFAVHALARPRPRPISVEERLSMLPRDRVPVDARVVIHWSEHQIPFIEAETDKDLATALGVVHAHLRIAQMEMLRCLSQGRVSELIGPIAIDLDHLLRILDFGRAVPAILEDLPLETRQWLDAFVAGINHHLDHARVLPFEFDVLKLHRKRWSVSDVLRIGRLVAADANWIVWFQLLRLRRRKDWPRLWSRLLQNGEAARPDPVSSRCDGCQLRFLELILGRASNSVAVSKARSTSGSALMANDPHLGVHLPGPWMIAGYKSPSHHAIGLMAPGLPFVAIGRNPWIAWGGTNLHAASSDFYDVSDLPAREITDRQENIGVRWWPDRQVTIRETTLGPVISDARLLGMGRCKPVALRWMGHRPSDEFTAMLKMNQARNWKEFQAAIGGIAVPGQTMIYADVQGRVGRAMAVRLPVRDDCQMRRFLLEPRDTGHWQHLLGGTELLAELQPRAGFVVSANEPPGPTPIPVGLFFSSPDRARRLTALIAGQPQIGLQDIAAVLDDTHTATSHELARLFSNALCAEDETATRAQREFKALLTEWDGRYEANSRGALAFELTLYHFVQAYYGRSTAAAYWASWTPRAFVLEDLRRTPETAFAGTVGRAVERSLRPFNRFGNWGSMHRLRLMHPFGYVPLAGSRYVFRETAARGGGDSVYRSAHPFTGDRHAAIYGTSARHVSDLSHPDHNFFVLLGGQDGWLGSATYDDQPPLWQSRAYIQLPLQPATARARFPHRTDLSP